MNEHLDNNQNLKQNMINNISDRKEIKDSLTKIEVKLDTAIKEKADKSDLKNLEDKGWAIILSQIA